MQGPPNVAVWSQRWFVALAVAVSYLVGSEAAFRFAASTGLDAVVFIPSGVTFAALVRTSPRTMWWVVLSAAAAVELGQDLRAGLSVAESSGFVVANVAEPLIGAGIVLAMVRRRLDLCRLWDVRWFVVGGVVIGPAFGAAIGAIVDHGRLGEDLVDTFSQWWIGDALGVLLVAGPLIAIGSSPDPRPIWSRSGVVLVGASVATTAAVLALSDLPLMFVVLTGVVVAGARFGTRGVSFTAIAVALTSATVLLIDDGDVIIGVSDVTGLMVVQLKLLVFTVGGLIVAAEVHERLLLVVEQDRLRSAAAEMDEEHRLVKRFQHLSLPTDHHAGRCFTARGRYLAASIGLGIGGDWYDVVELPDGRIYLCVGDVVGHGPEAAVTMSQLKVAMAIIARDSRRPADVLERIDSLAAMIPGAHCSTAWVGYFDPAAGVLSYASAGHPPAFMSDGAGVRRLDGAVAPPIMVVRDGPKPEHDVPIEEDVSLLLYTDGLIERRRGSIDDALDDVRRTLEQADDHDAVELAALEVLAGAGDDTVMLFVTLRPMKCTAVPHDAR
jgi:integral membrane sensor domain MASE1